jgi:glycosyltransferase involved in cell wall biosynthesis
MRELKKECQDGEVLIHLLQVPFDLSYLICLHLSDVPIVGAHIGGAPYTISFSSFIRHLPFSFVERKALEAIDKLVVSSRWILKRWARFHPNLTLFYPVGVDFDEFKPVDKKRARVTLGIPLGKKVLLHVGRFDVANGVDVILRVFQELKRNYDLELLLVGGLKTDPLYEEAISSGARVDEWLSQRELLKYYSAADLYVFSRFYSRSSVEDVEEFSGFGVAPLESLACGTPVVGTNLKHFLGTEDELRRVGKIPMTPDDVARCIIEVLEHPELYQNCRQIARKYYSWEAVVDHMVDIYGELFAKYYGMGVGL